MSAAIRATGAGRQQAGADGAIAGAEVVNAAPDGHALLLATNSLIAAVPALRKNPQNPTIPRARFRPVTDVGRHTFFLFAKRCRAVQDPYGR